MDYTSHNIYNIRLVLNPNDIIIRFENKINHRIWEKTYMERDFVEYQSLGGLEFIGRILRLAIQGHTKDLYLVDFVEKSKTLEFIVNYMNSVIGVINIQFSLIAIKRDAICIDLEDVNKRITDLMLKTTSMNSRLTQLEEMSGGYVILPGCPFAIDIEKTTLHIGLINTQYPMYDGGWKYGFVVKDVYYHEGLTDLTNLKYLKDCKELRLCNTHLIKDYSPIGQMTNLEVLKIVNTEPSMSTLDDITWIVNLKNLKEVSFYGCGNLDDITPLSSLEKLLIVDLRNCIKLNNCVWTSGSQFE